MRQSRSGPLSRSLMLAVVLVLAVACASTTLGRAIQAADAQKQLVEAAAVEFVKLHLRGDPRITEAVYTQGKAYYQRYYATQLAEANALAAWRAVGSVANESALTAALGEVTKHIDVYLGFVGTFVDLSALRQKLAG